MHDGVLRRIESLTALQCLLHSHISRLLDVLKSKSFETMVKADVVLDSCIVKLDFPCHERRVSVGVATICVVCDLVFGTLAPAAMVYLLGECVVTLAAAETVVRVSLSTGPTTNLHGH